VACWLVDLFNMNGKLWAELITKNGTRLGGQSVGRSDPGTATL
jgi:hypothetical protein